MKFCKEHWDSLREKVEAAGLGAFVASGGAEVVKRMVEGGFDPLMAAHNAIVSNAMSTAGLSIMMPNEDGSDRCPLCFLIANCTCGTGDACPFRAWPDRAVADQVEEAKKRGLIATA